MASESELYALIGTTASGKSALALEVAERAGAEIVSLDSMLVYRGMDIGTAKPGPAERARVPHHALDLVDPDRTFTVQDYLAAAESALADIAARGRRALLVGGTAFYLQALLRGLFEGPEVDRELRTELERRFDREGAPALHAELAGADPNSAARIHANDKKRVVRALEVWHQTGRPLSEWQQQWGTEQDARPHRVVGLQVETRALDERIAQRTRAMLDAGWAEEAQRIRGSCGFGPTADQALGYAEVLRWADGEIERAECERLVNLATRQFARRQRTWFRKWTQVRWIESPGNAEDLDRAAAEVLALFDWRTPTGS